VSQVVFSTWPTISQRLARVVIWLVSHLMNLTVPSARRELREIQGGLSASSAGTESDRELTKKLVRETANRLTSRNEREKQLVREMDARIERALKRIGLSMPTALEREQIVEDALRITATPPTTVSGSLVTTSDIPPLLGILTMGSLMTKRRRILLQSLSDLPARYAAEVGLFTPTLIDLSFWVDDMDISPLNDQIEVMSAIAAIKNRPYAMHPFVSFCPWRQLVERNQFDRVRAAVRDKGFIGVKLYPVMGFLPIGNVHADPQTYPRELRRLKDWAQRLDDALIALYEWASSEDVPIVAHCSESQMPSPEAGKRAAPQNWKPVLDTYGALRLNLAHCGGLWDLALKQHNDWTEKLIGMLARYPNLYADVSDYEAIMHRPGTRDEEIDSKVLPAVARFLDADGTGAARKKLMYGTDWVMLSRQMDVSTYYESMRTGLPSELRIDQKGFVGAHAARFLGIAMAGGTMPKTRQRLERFYQSNGLDKALLKRWD
jgi:predicted TIM-barrel fold metal-dependent hydrolase